VHVAGEEGDLQRVCLHDVQRNTVVCGAVRLVVDTSAGAAGLPEDALERGHHHLLLLLVLLQLHELEEGTYRAIGKVVLTHSVHYPPVVVDTAGQTTIDYLQHDHWGVTLSSATSLGSLDLRELMYFLIVNLVWKEASNQDKRFMRSLTFRTSEHLQLVIPTSMQLCDTGNLRKISLQGCTINTNTGFDMSETTINICHRCPHLAVIDFAS
jgi:hypothetical protein